MENKEKKKGLIETIKEVNQREEEKQRQIEKEKSKLSDIETKQREAYEKKLKNDKLELLKMKQGLVEETVRKEEVKKEYTFFQKIENFMYLNKTYVILASVFIFMAGFFTYEILTREEADVGMMVITNDSFLGADEKLMNLKELCEKDMTMDVNKDKKKLFFAYYMPVDPVIDDALNGANSTKLMALLSGEDTLLILADSTCEADVTGLVQLEDLSAIFPDNEHVDGTRFYLKDTKLLKEIGLETELVHEDCFICLRKVRDDLKPKKKAKMQEYYDASLEVLKILAEKYS